MLTSSQLKRVRKAELPTEPLATAFDPTHENPTDPERDAASDTILSLEAIARNSGLELPRATPAPMRVARPQKPPPPAGGTGHTSRADPLPVGVQADVAPPAPTTPPPARPAPAPEPPLARRFEPVSEPRREPAKDPLVGARIAGKYEILDLVAVGGMGKVYKARHSGLDRIVAVKTLRPALLSDKTIVGRFEREAKAASRLSHPNAIQVFDFGEDGHGSLYLAMEYVPGRDLRTLLVQEFPLGEKRLCHVMAQVLAALADAHAQGVIHRDLKPENIMVESRRGEPDYVKVLDFGIAKIVSGDAPTLTLADRICGTPLYMSPEQATGSKVDARADLYAVGVILYQLATGTLPFFSQNTVEILTKHVNEKATPPRRAAPDQAISADLEALILRAMSKDPDGRPATADEFRRELLAIAAKPDTVPSAPQSPPREVPRVTAPPPTREPPAPAPAPAAPPKPEVALDAADLASLSPHRGPIRIALAAGVGMLVLATLITLRPDEREGEPAPPQAAATAAPAAAAPPPPPACREGMALVAADRPFCVDRYEHPNAQGVKPTVRVTWPQAQAACATAGKRLCTEPEWVRACTGAPGGATSASADACGLAKHLFASGATGCATGEGIHDLTSNAGEWTASAFDGKQRLFTAKGGVRAKIGTSACDARRGFAKATKDARLGFRCCADPT